MPTRQSFMVFGAFLFTVLPSALTAELRIDEPLIRMLIPGQNKTAAYFDITNEGSTEVSLVSLASDSIGSIEMHRTEHDGNMVRMQRLTEVVLVPGKTVRFHPGGLHLMLFEVADLQEETEIQLLTSDGELHRTTFRRISLLESIEHYEHNR